MRSKKKMDMMSTPTEVMNVGEFITTGPTEGETLSIESPKTVINKDNENDNEQQGNNGKQKSSSAIIKYDMTYKDPLRKYHPSTAVIIAGYRSDLSEEAIKAPIFRSSTFEFHNAKEGELFFQRAYNLPGTDNKKPGLVYSRLNNPNTGK